MDTDDEKRLEEVTQQAMALADILSTHCNGQHVMNVTNALVMLADGAIEQIERIYEGEEEQEKMLTNVSVAFAQLAVKARDKASIAKPADRTAEGVELVTIMIVMTAVALVPGLIGAADRLRVQRGLPKQEQRRRDS